MTNLLRDYITAQLADRVKERRVVVWYDQRAEFQPFVDELRGSSTADLVEVELGDTTVNLIAFHGSYYAVRMAIEPLVSGDDAPAAIVYLPGITRDTHGSVLMELELAGRRWEPALRQLAGNALRTRFTAGVIDEVLGRERITYPELVALLDAGDGAVAPSVLKQVLRGSKPEGQIAAWLSDPALDALIIEKEAADELARLVASRLGIELSGEDLAKWRSIVARHVLGVEFRGDLAGALPSSVQHLPAATGDAERNARSVAQLLRDDYPLAYPALADRAAAELKLDATSVDALQLGAIDTFRFEEAALLTRCAALLVDGAFATVAEIAAERQDSFWLQGAIDRRAQWEAVRLAAELGTVADAALGELRVTTSDPTWWVDRYADHWHRLDRAQRHLEALLPRLEEDADERAIAAVRARYDDVVAAMAQGFVAALEGRSWAVEGALQQTSIYEDVVRTQPGRVAFFLVDAMRYEMGAELAERMDGHGEVIVRPAVSVLPSITPMGMAALMPGAASSYDVVEHGGQLTARIDGAHLPDLKSRQKQLAARVASSADISLGDVLAMPRSRLEKKLGTSELVVVRSQEIDLYGEGGFEARAIMDTVMDNLARAVRKLAQVGVDRAVLTADHGHLYAADDRDESMRIDAPGGVTIDLHRRCWIGHGGATPPGCVRVAARSLGNDSDLDFVFPRGIGVFRAGGDLAFHHGGPTLQEMIVPVITVRSTSAAPTGAGGVTVSVTEVPAAITTRIFSVKMALASLAVESVTVQPILMSGERQVGEAGMALGADHDRSAGTIVLTPGVESTVGFILDDDAVSSIRIVVLDPTTDADVYRSADVPVQLGVS